MVWVWQPVVKVHFIETGSHNKSAVVLIHGLGATGESWYFQLKAAAEAGFRVIAPDLPGFGRSKYSGRFWDIKTISKELVSFLSGAGLREYFLAGISLGGAVALQAALDFPERVRGLMLINTFACLKPHSLSEWVYFTRRGILAFLRSPAVQAKMVADRVFPHPDQHIYRQMLVENINKANPRVYRQAMIALAKFDVRNRLAELNKPVWVVSGAADTTIPLMAQYDLVRRIPNARHYCVSEAGHAVNIDRPEEFNRILLKFLSESGL